MTSAELDRLAAAIAEHGHFDLWMREAHLDARNGTRNAERLVRTFLANFAERS